MGAIQNNLFTVVGDPNYPEKVHVEPTEYLSKLAPHEVINKLRAYVEKLAEDLEKSVQEDLSVHKNLEKVQALTSELETTQLYLAQVFESWKQAQGRT